jgi:PDZ domain-containing secreted protein
VIFATTLNPAIGAYGAERGRTRVIQLPGFTNLYLAVGTIGTVNDKVTAAVNAIKPGAILFSASPKNPAASATETPSGMVGGESVKFIAYDGNDLAKFANDIVRETKPGTTQKVSTFRAVEKQIAAVLKASANLGITGAEQLVPSADPTSYYAKWKLATEKLLSA